MSHDLPFLLFCALFTHGSSRFGVVGEVWKRYINTVSVNTMAVGPPDDIVQSIPPSFYEHDCEQLRIGRVGAGVQLGECCEGKNCVGYLFRGNNTPLHPYLTVSQQREFETHGTLIEGPCLLDIRKKVTGIAMLYRNDCIGVRSLSLSLFAPVAQSH